MSKTSHMTSAQKMFTNMLINRA